MALLVWVGAEFQGSEWADSSCMYRVQAGRLLLPCDPSYMRRKCKFTLP